MNEKIIWSNVLTVFKNEVSTLSFETWFKDTELHELKDDKAIILVSLPIQKRHLSDNYTNLIKEALKEQAGYDYEIEFILKDELEEKIQEKEKISTINVDIFENNQSNLKKNYTFESFIVGNSNKFAHAAALSVAENPGKTYNPLFLYGNSGLGKTHLMHAIPHGNQTLPHHSGDLALPIRPLRAWV